VCLCLFVCVCVCLCVLVCVCVCVCFCLFYRLDLRYSLLFLIFYQFVTYDSSSKLLSWKPCFSMQTDRHNEANSRFSQFSGRA
jgi:hypothetical protein